MAGVGLIVLVKEDYAVGMGEDAILNGAPMTGVSSIGKLAVRKRVGRVNEAQPEPANQLVCELCLTERMEMQERATLRRQRKALPRKHMQPRIRRGARGSFYRRRKNVHEAALRGESLGLDCRCYTDAGPALTLAIIGCENRQFSRHDRSVQNPKQAEGSA